MLLAIAALFLFYFTASAQKIEQFYDWNWKLTEPTTARYYAVIEKQDSNWHRQDFFIHERRLQMDGFYKDPDSKIAHGPFQYFHPNGQLESAGSYTDGKRQGVWLRYHSNGMMQDSATYEKGNTTGIKLGWYPNGFLSDSSSINADGSGMSIRWFDNGNPSEAGRYSAGGKLHGKWQFFHKNGQPSAVEMYQEDKLLSKQYFDESGAAVSDTTSRDREASFPGGLKAWQKYLLKQLYFPAQYQISNADKAIVVVSWIINEDGTISDVNVTTPLHPSFDKIAADAIRKSPAWQPAIMHNRTVKAYRRQPVTFAQ